MRALRLLWWRIRYAFWRFNWRLMLAVTKWRTLHGMKVGVFAALDDTTEIQAFEKIEAALSLIRTYEPRRLQRISRDIALIWVQRDAYAAACYIEAWRLCAMDIKFVTSNETTLGELSTTLVHEATHARLMGRGIPYAESLRSRIESICVAESVAFARRLPNGEALASHLADSLPAEASHWSNENLSHRMQDAKLQELHELPIPNWLKRILRRVVLRRAA